MTRYLARHAVCIVAVAPLMAGLELGRRIYATNDDARFAVLAQDVLSHGFRLFPDLNGVPYYNKPALLAWLIALASWPAGAVSQLTAALPSAVAGVGLAFVVLALGRGMFGADAGRYAALVAVATQGFFLQARLPLPDMLMTLFITTALWHFWRMTRSDAHAAHWVGFYGFTAAAFWTKGPAGFLPLAVVLGWALVNRRDAGWRRLRVLRGLALLVVLVGPWWLFALRADSAAVRDTVVVDQLLWYLPVSLTLKSVAAPLRNSFGTLFPWTLVVPLVLVQAIRCARGEDAERRDVRALLVWVAVTFVVVGASRQQRLRYYLPLVPPAALLIGWWLASAVPKRREAARMPWRVYAALVLLLVAVTAGTLLANGRLPRDAAVSLPASLGELLVLAGALGAMLLALAWGVRFGRIGRAFAGAWVGSAVFVAGAYHWEVGRFNVANDYPRVSERMRPVLREASVVATWGLPALAFSFYFDRPVVAVETSADLDRVMSGKPAVAIMTEGELARQDHDPLEVLMSDRLALRAISLVRKDVAKRL